MSKVQESGENGAKTIKSEDRRDNHAIAEEMRAVIGKEFAKMQARERKAAVEKYRAAGIKRFYDENAKDTIAKLLNAAETFKGMNPSTAQSSSIYLTNSEFSILKRMLTESAVIIYRAWKLSELISDDELVAYGYPFDPKVGATPNDVDRMRGLVDCVDAKTGEYTLASQQQEVVVRILKHLALIGAATMKDCGDRERCIKWICICNRLELMKRNDSKVLSANNADNVLRDLQALLEESMVSCWYVGCEGRETRVPELERNLAKDRAGVDAKVAQQAAYEAEMEAKMNALLEGES